MHHPAENTMENENVTPENKVEIQTPTTPTTPLKELNIIEQEDGDGDVTEKLSFQDLISSMAGSQQQQGASLPFYFICLLHLANEKVHKYLYILHRCTHTLIL